MTTYTNFAPSTVAPFQFQATLDGEQYNVIVTWGLFGNGPAAISPRYFINVYALDGTLIVCTALVGSPTALALSGLTWNANNNRVTATTAKPHGYKIGTVVGLTISGCTPNAYNGHYQCLITGPSTVSYALSNNPGAATVLGAAAYNVDLLGGYFAQSSLIYRTQATQFEVSP